MSHVNIRNAEQLERSGLTIGDPVHVGVCGPGQSTNDGEFAGRLIENNMVVGVKVSIRGTVHILPWGDIIELWPITPRLAHSGPRKDFRVAEFENKVRG